MAEAVTSDALLYNDELDQVMTGEAVALDLHPTSLILAAAGAAIDFVVYLGLEVLMILLLVFLVATGGLPQDSDAVTALVSVSFVTSLIVVPVVVELLSRGKSLGRLAVGARIVRDDGGAITFRHAFIRALVGVVEIFSLLGGGALLVGLFSSKSKRLGDLLAGTYSQYERVSRVPELTFAVPVELQTWALTADVARIPNRLSQRLSQFLRQLPTLSPVTRDRLGRTLANEVSAWVSPIPATTPELFLIAVVALRRDREFAALELEKERLAHLQPALTGTPYNFPDR